MLRGRQHRVARDFRTRARRGGNGDAGRGRFGQLAAATDDFEVVQKIPLIRHHAGDGFAGIQDAPAAKADHQAATLLSRQRRAAPNCVQIRFAGHGEHSRADAGLPQRLEQWRGAAGVASRHHERRAAQLPGHAASLTHSVSAKDDASSRGEFKLHNWPRMPRTRQKDKRKTPAAGSPRSGLAAEAGFDPAHG